MPSFDDNELLDALSTPIGDLVSSVGRSVADAQLELDRSSIAALRELYSSDEDLARMLVSIGYRPTWYQIPAVDAELSVALTVTGERTENGSDTSGGRRRRRLRMFAAPVDATYTNKYEFELTASSRVRFKVVPIPPPPAAEQLKVVPVLTAMTWSEARDLLMQLGVPLDSDDPADEASVVTAQDPAAGAVLAPGQGVTLTV